MNTKWQRLMIAVAMVFLAAMLGESNMAMAVDFGKLKQERAAEEKVTAAAAKAVDDTPDDADNETADAPDHKPTAPTINAAWEFERANRLASAGALTRSIPHYKKVLEAAPGRYIQAYFNLGEVYRLKGECREAVLLFGLYLNMETNEANRADAKTSRETCLQGSSTGEVSLEASLDYATLLIDGYQASAEGKIEKLRLLSGTYTVEIRADEHISQTIQLEVVEAKPLVKKIDLEKMLFFGTLKITVSKPNATVRIEPRKLDSKKAGSEVLTLSSPLEGPIKLATGKYFIEVTLQDSKRWIRNVDILRDEVAVVEVQLKPEVPEAIRPR